MELAPPTRPNFESTLETLTTIAAPAGRVPEQAETLKDARRGRVREVRQALPARGSRCPIAFPAVFLAGTSFLPAAAQQFQARGRCLDNPWVLDLLPDPEHLFKQADRLLRLAQGGVGEAQVAEGAPLAEAIADLARDRQPLLVEADRLLHLAQGGVGEAQAAEGAPLAVAIADLAPITKSCSEKPIAFSTWPKFL